MINTVLIKQPVISEKSIKDATRGIYTFEVDIKANKIEIKKAVESEFEVHVINISSSKIRGKEKMIGKTRKKVKMPDSKKAWVRLKKGEKISIFEIGEK